MQRNNNKIFFVRSHDRARNTKTLFDHIYKKLNFIVIENNDDIRKYPGIELIYLAEKEH